MRLRQPFGMEAMKDQMICPEYQNMEKALRQIPIERVNPSSGVAFH